LKVGDLVKIDGGSLGWALEFAGVSGLIIDTDTEQGSVYVVTEHGIEEFHTYYCEVINESR
jgi:hypothetical protein